MHEQFHDNTPIHYRQLFSPENANDRRKIFISRLEATHIFEGLQATQTKVDKAFCTTLHTDKHYTNFARHCPVLRFQSTTSIVGGQ